MNDIFFKIKELEKFTLSPDDIVVVTISNKHMSKEVCDNMIKTLKKIFSEYNYKNEIFVISDDVKITKIKKEDLII